MVIVISGNYHQFEDFMREHWDYLNAHGFSRHDFRYASTPRDIAGFQDFDIVYVGTYYRDNPLWKTTDGFDCLVSRFKYKKFPWPEETDIHSIVRAHIYAR